MTNSLIDEKLVQCAIQHAIDQLPKLLVEPLMPVSGGGASWVQAFRVYDHVPGQKGEQVILAEHCATKPRLK